MNIRIVDIAKLAGVSVGTVDRVLHNRGRVSDDKKEKVEKVLKEINYEPNMVARFLASNRNYKFAAIVPSHSSGEYWHLVCEGINRAVAELKKFNISIDFYYFNQYDKESFLTATKKMEEKPADGILITTHFKDYAIDLSKKLDENGTSYIYIDSDIPGQNDLAYFGGDTFASGAIAAKLIIKEIGLKADIVFAHIKFKHKDISVQMKSREEGFLSYLKKKSFSGEIYHVELNPDDHNEGLKKIEQILKKSDTTFGAIVLNSRIYELTAILEKLDPAIRNNIVLIGHDAINKNIKALKENKITYLLSQRPELQGYNAIKALGNYFLFNQKPEKTNYMPIDILIEENIDYYNNYKL